MRNPISDVAANLQPSGIRKFFDIVSEMDDARARLMRMGLDDAFPAEIGSAAHLREHYGLDAESIVARIRAEL